MQDRADAAATYSGPLSLADACVGQLPKGTMASFTGVMVIAGDLESTLGKKKLQVMDLADGSLAQVSLDTDRNGGMAEVPERFSAADVRFITSSGKEVGANNSLIPNIGQAFVSDPLTLVYRPHQTGSKCSILAYMFESQGELALPAIGEPFDTAADGR